MSRFFITGGAGYIGSHTAKLLAGAGREVIAYDKLSRGHRDLVRWGPLIEADIRDTSTLREAVSRFKPGAVIRFAGLAYVRESVTNPQLYFEHNVTGTLSLLKAMASIQMNNLVVSSTCAVYGQPAEVPVSEETSPRPLNPYGQSKLMMERICEDFRAAQGLHFTALRYFNACGCDPAGETGERHDPEPHLIPRALMAAEGDLAELECSAWIIRRLTALASGITFTSTISRAAHMAAALQLMQGGFSGVLNLGSGKGVSVREIIEAAARVTGRPVPHRFSARREGDPAVLIADVRKANSVLNWHARNSGIDHIMATAWQSHAKERGWQHGAINTSTSGIYS